MAFFSGAKKVVPNGGAYKQPQNAGFVLKLTGIEKAEGGVLLRGVAQTESTVSAPGQEAAVFMSDANFRSHLGHNLSRSLKDYADEPEGHFNGSEVVLSRCYKEKEQLIARGGAMGTYCTNGRVKSARSIATAVVGRPVIQLIDKTDKATVTMEALPVDAENVRVRMEKDGVSGNFVVPVADFIAELENKVVQQAEINKRILAGQGSEPLVLYVSMPVFNPKEAFAVASADDLNAASGMLMLVAENGKSRNYAFGGTNETPEERAKKLEGVTKFITENGPAQAVPYVRINFNKGKAVEVAQAYVNYLKSRGVDMTFQERWKSHEHVLSAFNNLAGKYTPSNLILETYQDNDTQETRYSMERAVPSTSESVDAMPGIQFNGNAPAPDLGTEEPGGDEPTMDDSNMDKALTDALSGPPSSNPGTAMPRRVRGAGGLSM